MPMMMRHVRFSATSVQVSTTNVLSRTTRTTTANKRMSSSSKRRSSVPSLKLMRTPLTTMPTKMVTIMAITTRTIRTTSRRRWSSSWDLTAAKTANQLSWEYSWTKFAATQHLRASMSSSTMEKPFRTQPRVSSAMIAFRACSPGTTTTTTTTRTTTMATTTTTTIRTKKMLRSARFVSSSTKTLASVNPTLMSMVCTPTLWRATSSAASKHQARPASSPRSRMPIRMSHPVCWRASLLLPLFSLAL
mmetsp:Transcript_49401/g.105006  ORF Transcript_49401/g.105006 Transcript_49401/m.105006 type:complete len:247 (-) Transcript_49401:208-948(-)